MHRKKLCLVIPSLQAGGMERVMNELAGYFCQKDNLEVHLVMYGRKPEIFYNIPSNLIIHKPESAFNNTFRFVASLGRLIYLRRGIKTINPDSILSFGEYWNNFVMLSLLGLKFRIYLSDRSQPDKKLTHLHECLRKVLYPKATGIIAQTSIAKNIFNRIFRNPNIKVIGNPVREICRDSKNKTNTIIRENIVLTIGRMIRSKHHDRLINIFARINQQDWKLVIIGEDHLKQNNMNHLKQLAKKLCVEERVVFTGKLNFVDEYYLKSKIFAFTSSSEGFPNVVAEALSAGLPVVAYDCIAGPSELIINGENGFLTPVFDDLYFQEKLQLLMANEDLRSSMSAKAKNAIEKYQIDKIGELYLDFVM